MHTHIRAYKQGRAGGIGQHDWVHLDVHVSSGRGDEVHVGVSGLGGLFGALGPRVTCQEDEDAIRIEVVAVPVPLAAADCGGGGGLDAGRGHVSASALGPAASQPPHADQTFLSAVPVEQERRQAEAARLAEHVLLSEPLSLRTLFMTPGFQGRGSHRRRVGVLEVADKPRQTVAWIHDGVSTQSQMNPAIPQADAAVIDAMPPAALLVAFLDLFPWRVLHGSRRYFQQTGVAVGTVVPSLDPSASHEPMSPMPAGPRSAKV